MNYSHKSQNDKWYDYEHIINPKNQAVFSSVVMIFTKNTLVTPCNLQF